MSAIVSEHPLEKQADKPNGKPPLPVRATERGLVLTSMDDMWRFAKCVATSGLAPRGMERPETVLVAIQLGLEIGLSPMSALQNIAVVNGRPSIYGDAALALVRASGLLEEYREWYEVKDKKLTNSEGVPRNPTPAEVKEDTCTCYVHSKRKGDKNPQVTSFSTADAKLASLWGDSKRTPWIQYPARMLKFRARGFNLRDNFGDVLKGLHTTEEIDDTQRTFAPALHGKREEATSRVRELLAAAPTVRREPEIIPLAAAGPGDDPPADAAPSLPTHAEAPKEPEQPAAPSAPPPDTSGLQDLIDSARDRIDEANEAGEVSAVIAELFKVRAEIEAFMGEMQTAELFRKAEEKLLMVKRPKKGKS